MPDSPATSAAGADAASYRRDIVLLLAVVAAMAFVRLPVMWKQPGGMDEELFAVPGWTVWQEGIPRIPYMPPRAVLTGFQHSDRLLFALPPLSFYCQAPFHAMFGPGYFAARAASLVAGMAAVGLVYVIGRQLGVRREACLAAAALYSVSRAVHFPATIARPDMLCTVLQLGAVSCFLRAAPTGRIRGFVPSGLLLGLAGLTHPTALVAAIQLGAGCLLLPGTATRRLGRLAVMSLCAMVAASLWWGLIRLDPALFLDQFFANVIDRSGPGLAERLLAPWQAAWAQVAPAMERLNPVQFGMGVVGTLGPIALRGRVPRAPGWMAFSGVALLVLLLRQSHPAHGYWSYSAAFWLLGLASLAPVAAQHVWPRLPAGVIYAIAFGLSLPGAGLQASLEAWRCNDCHSSRSCFVSSLIERLPEGKQLLVDPAFVFDVYLSGRDTTLAVFDPDVAASQRPEYDFLIVSRYGIDNRHRERFGGERVFSLGDPHDPFACFADVFRPSSD